MTRFPAVTVTIPTALAALFAVAPLGCDEPAVTEPSDVLRPPQQPPIEGGEGEGEPGEGEGEGEHVPVPRCEVTPVDEDGVVSTTNGNVRGERLDGTWRFRGVRYAAAPVGELRFAPPQEPECSEGIVDALDYGASCPQLGLLGDEDCLFLNVWSPALGDEVDAPAPVMFFIHGGANILGEASQALPFDVLYDGQALAEETGSVVVTVNYRLGPLGFLAHPALTARDGSSGNQAIRDLVLALQWTRDNIGAFGGDSQRVMIFGESAGALNTCGLVATPHAAGLFHAALMESGGCEAPPLAEREAQGVEAMASIGCDAPDDLQCLLDADPALLVSALAPLPNLVRTWALTWGLTTDGDVFPRSPLATIRAGEHNRVPFIAGSNAEEMNLFVPPVAINTCLDLALATSVLIPDHADAALEEYPCFSRGLPHDTFIAASTDLVFTCQARRVASAMAASQSEPVWRYHFRDRANTGPMLLMGAFHAAELFFVFDKLQAMPGYISMTSGEEDLTKQMQRFWGRLAQSGDPNAPGEFEWPESDGDNYIVFDEDPLFGMELSTEDGDVDEGCDFWDSVSE